MSLSDDHKAALERAEHYAFADRLNRELAADDLRFIAGEQWDARLRRSREATNKPVITENVLPQFINQVVGDFRQTRPSIHPIPAEGASDDVMTAIMAGLIRQIEYQSKAQSVYSWGVHCQASCGIGHWQIATEYQNDDSFNQDILIKRIIDPLAVIWDSAATELDRSDATECFVTEMMTQEAFKRRFKTDKMPTEFPKPFVSNDGATMLSWISDDGRKVRVASHWWTETVDGVIGMTKAGQTIDLTGKKEGEYAALGVLRSRAIKKKSIKHAIMSGDGYLDEPQTWAGSFIPIVPVIGNEAIMDGYVVRQGVIRHAKDPQRMRNFFRSVAAQVIGEQPKTPWLLPIGSIDGLEDYWNRADDTTLKYLPWRPDPMAPGAKPEREPPPQGSMGMYEEIKMAQQATHETTGIYPSSLGGKSNETSGRAISARQKEADTGTYVFHDNASVAVQRTGEILVDLIPKVMDGERIVRVLGKDGQEAMTSINMMHNDPIAGTIIVNDISAAKFDVHVQLGSSNANSREIMHEALSGVFQANPEMFKIFGDKYLESLDVPQARELAARLRKTMPAEIVGPEGVKPQGPDPIKQAMVEADIATKHAVAADKGAQAEGRQLDNARKAYEFGHAHAHASLLHPMPQKPNPGQQGQP
ncbi:hypothetical protein KGP36_07160 [Patescibacteria group bacterium]|nr:hypothetical protein [Patescibacteria group bacterium]